MARYADGFVVPVPKKNLKAYLRLARLGSRVWRDHGALQYCESVGEDLQVKFGVPFPKQMKTKRGETVVLSWIVFKSRAHRDQVNARVMKDPRLAGMTGSTPMPFDCKRMVYGGFSIEVDS
jgi:uncharacterized protein YbaA (DUF1428 family)